MNNTILKKISSILLISLLILNLLPFFYSTTEGSQDNRTGDTDTGIIRSYTSLIQIEPGEDFYVYFDPADLILEAEPPQDLPEECHRALDIVPDWLKMNLTHKFYQLTDNNKITYADLILNSPDSRYIDEIAFCVAHSAVENLQSDYMFPELFIHNAELIYDSDEFLNYVKIVEKDDYTTVVYTDDNKKSIEIPRDIYYWYIVHPKLSDELPTYVDPNYDFTSQPPFSRNYGVAPPVGKYWRDWLFNHNDTATDYDGPAKQNPLLKALLSECETIRNAVKACNNWMSNSMSFTSDNERPIQPVRIYRKHIGRCGEYQDMRNAIARAGLIPSTCTLNSAEDHVWNEFWDQRWIHWDGSIDKPNSYDNDLGGYFHKDLSSVWNTRGDSHIWSVTSRYTPICNFTATVVDSMWWPVDGALVAVETENYYNQDLRTTTTWGTTDYTGNVTIPLGNLRNYWASAETDDLGQVPPVGTTSVISNSEIGVNYAYTFNLPLTAPSLKGTEIDEPVIDEEKYRMEIDYEVVGNILSVKNEYTGEHGDLYGPSGNIDFFIVHDMNYNLYQNGLTFAAYNIHERSTSGDVSFVLPSEERYYAVLSNGFSQATTKIIKVTVTVVSDLKVEITSPPGGAVVKIDDFIHITGTAWGPAGVGKVEVSLDDYSEWKNAGSTAGADEAPFSTWEHLMDISGITPGVHTIWAKAIQGDYSTITSINLSLIDQKSPTITIENPVDGAVLGPAEKVTLQGQASDNVELSNVDLVIDSDYENEIDLLPYLAGTTWTYDISTSSLEKGDHTLTINAIDTSSNSASESINFKIKDLIVPEVRINSPYDGYIAYLGDSVDITGIADDNTQIASLEIIIDNKKMDILSNMWLDGSWSYRWDTEISASSEGVHYIEVVAADDSGNKNSHGISINLDGTPPQADINSPLDNQIFSADDNILIKGTAYDQCGISRLELIFDNKEPIDITEELSNGNWIYDYTNFYQLESGEHTLTVLATDKVGHQSETARTIMIDAEGPFASISAPRDRYDIGDSIDLSGTAYDDINIDKVTLIFEDGIQIDITAYLTGERWQYVMDTSDMTEGRFTVTVIVTDSVGNSASDDITLRFTESQTVPPGTGEEQPTEKDKNISDYFTDLGIYAYIFIAVFLIMFLVGFYLLLDKSKSR